VRSRPAPDKTLRLADDIQRGNFRVSRTWWVRKHHLDVFVENAFKLLRRSLADAGLHVRSGKRLTAGARTHMTNSVSNISSGSGGPRAFSSLIAPSLCPVQAPLFRPIRLWDSNQHKNRAQCESHTVHTWQAIKTMTVQSVSFEQAVPTSSNAALRLLSACEYRRRPRVVAGRREQKLECDSTTVATAASNALFTPRRLGISCM